MGLSRDRTRQGVRGLGLLEIRQISPIPDLDFQDAGYLDVAGTDFQELVDLVERKDENGRLTDVIEKGRGTLLQTNLAQVGIDEMNLMRNAGGVLYALRYSGQSHEVGTFQCFAMDQVKLDPSLSKKYHADAQTLPFKAFALHQDEDILGYNQPDYYLDQVAGPVPIKNSRLIVAPDLALNTGTAKLLDISGWGLHGTLSGTYTWGTSYLRFDGATASCAFGDALDDDGVSDFAVSIWVRIQAANGTQIPGIVAKKTSIATGAGVEIFRDATNKLNFRISDGTNTATVISTSTLLQNVWLHLLIAVDRNGNGQLYSNGIADGAAVSVAGVGSAANSLPLQIGADGTNFGQADIGRYRHWIYGAGNLPANIATIANQVFQAERGIPGV